MSNTTLTTGGWERVFPFHEYTDDSDAWDAAAIYKEGLEDGGFQGDITTEQQGSHGVVVIVAPSEKSPELLQNLLSNAKDRKQ